VRELVLNVETKPEFSVVSIWEIAIKQSRGRDDFRVDAGIVRQQLLTDEYSELPVLGEHAAAVASLPPLHKDPFDRLLVAQAIVEDMEFLTADTQLASYPGPIRVIA
jgi:PIN domain nuclease of toxin-antitoxin system